MPPSADPPTGTVTFLITDIEGSTRLVQDLGDAVSNQIFADHRRILVEAVQSAGGSVYQDQGESFVLVFARAKQAVLGAVAAQRALEEHAWPNGGHLRVRMGLHTGEPVGDGGEYVGLDVHRAARICGAGHGGQILLSQTTRDLVADDFPDGVGVRDLGDHRLKDLTRPQRLFQVVISDLPSDFPPLRSLDVRPNNLPIQVTSFIGREREKAEVKRLLSTTRLLTLTGSGGAGKTRLALQAAAEMVEEFGDGMWVVELASLSDSAFVPKAVASAMNVPEQPGRPLSKTLEDYLRSRSLLLLLDSCEHLLTACAHLAEALLRACPDLRVLATSREALGIEGEATYRVPSLSLPDALSLPVERLTECEAVRLFIDRARAALPGFVVTAQNARAVATICQQLDGIPLAIELAAPKVRVLTVERIAERLHDRFGLLTSGRRTALPRQQTLRAALDWSHELLSEPERVLLRRLSVFAGGFTLEAAEAVCAGQGVKGAEIIDLLTRLVEKSLVVFQESEERYRLLETVRQYGWEKLLASGEEVETRRRHRDWYLELALGADARLRGPEEDFWLERLEAEHENLRAAIEWTKQDEHGAENELRIAAALEWFWYLRGHWTEGRARLEEALARSDDAPESALPKVLVGLARLAYRQGDQGRAKKLCERGLALSRKLGHKAGIAWFLLWLGIIAMAEADQEGAIPLLENSLALFREIGDKWWTVEALAFLGDLAEMQRDFERAAALHLESLGLSRETGNTNNITFALRNLGLLALRQGDYERATVYYIEGLVLSKKAKTPGVIAECLEGLARAACARAEYEHAARLFGAAEALFEHLGGQLSLYFDQSDHERYVTAARAGLGETAFLEARHEGHAMTLEQAIEYALGAEAT